MSNSKTSVRVRKMDVFDKASKAHLGGLRGDKKQFENYVGKRGLFGSNRHDSRFLSR